MGVCLVTGGKSHYSGLCVFGAQDIKATILAYADLRVKTTYVPKCLELVPCKSLS